MAHIRSRPISWRIASVVCHSCSLENIQKLSDVRPLLCYNLICLLFTEVGIIFVLPALVLYQLPKEIEFVPNYQVLRLAHDRLSNCWQLEAVNQQIMITK